MILPLILAIPVLAFLVSLFVKRSGKALGFIALTASAAELCATGVVVASVMFNGPYALYDILSVGAMEAVMMMALFVVGAIASWHSMAYLGIEMQKGIIGFSRVRQYFILLHLFILAMIYAIMTTNPIFMWIAIEATTLSTAFLVSFYNKPSAMEAAWKYLLINSVGLLLGFLGTLLFLYPAVHNGVEGLTSWSMLSANVSSFNPYIAKIAFILILIGFGTKVGFVPMHTWRPDAYSKTPTPLVSLLSGALLNVAFLAILRFKTVADLVLGREYTGSMLIFFGLLSVIVSAFIMLTQKNYKRLLAYSSIEHAGIIALGFGFGGAAAFAALLHMVYHSLAKSIMFLSAGNILLKFGSTKMKNVKGVLAVLPATGVMFIIGFLALTGIPPFGMFYTEFSILSVGMHAYPAVVIAALLAFALVFIGFLRQVVALLFGESTGSVEKGESGWNTTAPVIVLVVMLIILSLYIPTGLHALLQSAVAGY